VKSFSKLSPRSFVGGMLTSFVGLALISAPASAIVVTPTGNAETLVNTLLSPGITLVPGSATLTGGNLGNSNSSAGTFTQGSTTGIGIDQGIVLTTGQANLVTNTNTDDGSTGNFGGLGDAQLTSLAGVPTFDATVLSFSFTSSTGNLFFQFAFGSEEYNEFANAGVNDTFGFFVDGVNIALLPGTNTPISINTVNGGNPFGVNAQNSQYFNNNDLSNGGPFFNFSYDGFTSVFTVSAQNLSAGQHTIKLAIADGGDRLLDSGVFIKSGSFTPTNPGGSVPDAGSSLLLMTCALSALAALRRRRL
jgi:hypothetical protein